MVSKSLRKLYELVVGHSSSHFCHNEVESDQVAGGEKTPFLVVKPFHRISNSIKQLYITNKYSYS